MVLGVQWLETLGPIVSEYKKLEMSFTYKGKKVMLHGVKPVSIRETKDQRFTKKMDEGIQHSLLYVQAVDEEDSKEEKLEEGTDGSDREGEDELSSLFALSAEHVLIDQSVAEPLLAEFTDVFATPAHLPPFKPHHNHKIVLKEASNPVNQRPYCYVIHQKNEIDKIVEEMIEGGTIQPSSSPYSSPVVLVKKRDGTWRLCVNYRELNGMTVKDRFPIPLIEDLMDELGGSKIYSKIDLRADYHQVRMEEDGGG